MKEEDEPCFISEMMSPNRSSSFRLVDWQRRINILLNCGIIKFTEGGITVGNNFLADQVRCALT